VSHVCRWQQTKGVAKRTDTAETLKWNEKWSMVKKAICNHCHWFQM